MADERSDSGVRATSAPEPPEPAGTTEPRSGSPARWRPVLTLVAGLALGFLIAVLVTGRWPVDSTGAVDPDVQAAADARPRAPTEPAVAQADAAAASGRAAVDGFLEAEIAGDVADAYAYLSASAQEQFRTASGWEAAHADVLPPITGFSVDETVTTADGVEVSGTLRMTPGLDEVIGLVPSEAAATWVAVEDGQGRWGVDLEASTIDPRYPDDGGAADAAADWARARQRCEPAREYVDGLIGTTGPAEQLCGSGGAIELSDAEPLGDVDAAPFQAAFGDDATTWARVVEIAAPVPQRVVLAPVGGQWLVIGVLAPR